MVKEAKANDARRGSHCVSRPNIIHPRASVA